MNISTPHVDALSRRGVAWAIATALCVVLALQVQGLPAARAVESVPVTYQGTTYPAGDAAPTADKPQSKLWFNDGAWWALMRTPDGVTIHRLGADHAWRDTGTVVDERPASTGDALWEGGKLYVASRVSNGPPLAIRFSYDPTTATYTREFSRQVGNGGSESISIARDTLGRLWVTFTRGMQVYVAHSQPGDDTAWTPPYVVTDLFPGTVLATTSRAVTADDISAVVAFGGRVGVMWSDQDDGVMRFAVHVDGADDTEWSLEDALSGVRLADDHINLKSLLEDDEGRIYAAVKTSRGDSSSDPVTDPSLMVLQRDRSGTWTGAVAATVADGLTRPQLALDRTNRRVYVLMSTEGGGTVYFKSTSLGALSFPSGSGTPFVTWPGAKINDASTTKQPVDATTGLVVLASDDEALRYYHGELSLSGSDGTPPTVPTALTAVPTSTTSVGLSWQPATDDTAVSDYRVFRDGVQVGTSSSPSFSDAGLTPGTAHSYTVAAADAAGNVSAQSSPPVTATPSDVGTGAIAFVGAATVTGSTTSTAVAPPAGAEPGDLLIAAVSVRGNPSIMPPAGWELVRLDANGTTMRQAVFVRPATMDNGSTWTFSTAKDNVVQVVAYRGVDTAAPVLASSGALSTSATITSPAVTSTDGAQVVTFAGIARATTLAPTPPLTERSEITTTGAASYKVSADSADATAQGAVSGPYTTIANGSAGGVGQTLALRPGAGGGAATDRTAPTAPSGLAAGTVTATSIELVWTASTDDSAVTGYRVHRDGILVGTTPTTSFADSGLTVGTAYRYTVAAFDAAGNVSPPSAAVSVSTLSASPAPGAEAVTFVSASTATGSGSSTTLTAPLGATTGDVLVAVVAVRGTSKITTSAGWTLVRLDANGTTMRQAVFVRAATADNTSTWTLSPAKDHVIQVLAYRGVDTIHPVVASAGAPSTTATIDGPAVTSVNGARVVTFAAIARTATLAPGDPLVERSEITTSATARYKITADASDTSAAGTTAGPYATTASGTAGGVGQTVALRPRS